MRYVPKLRRNLISLGTLYALRYSIKIDNGAMRVLKVSFVALNVISVNGLYLLHGFSLVTKKVASLVKSLDSVMLWHRRLGHISEKGYLSKIECLW